MKNLYDKDKVELLQLFTEIVGALHKGNKTMALGKESALHALVKKITNRRRFSFED